MSSAKIDFVFQNETAESINEQALQQHLESILQRLGPTDRLSKSAGTNVPVVEVVFVGDAKIKQLNKQYRQVDAETDVLSFESPTDLETETLGSIVVSVETAARQAQKGGILLIEELKMLAGHGLLHLLGFHHR